MHFKVSWTSHVTPIPKSLDGAVASAILCAVRISLGFLFPYE